MTVRETINALGGAAAVAQQMRVSRQAVYNWHSNNCFPARLYLRMSALAREKKVFLDPELFESTNSFMEGKGNGKRAG